MKTLYVSEIINPCNLLDYDIKLSAIKFGQELELRYYNFFACNYLEYNRRVSVCSSPIEAPQSELSVQIAPGDRDLVRKIKCELRAIYRDYKGEFEDWAVKKRGD